MQEVLFKRDSMRNSKDFPVCAYMVRHFIKVSLSDPLPSSERGAGLKYTQYFSGDGTASQVNYLEYAPLSSNSFIRCYLYNSTSVDWDLKTETTHYTRNVNAQTVKWVSTPTNSNDNVKIVYDHVKGWIYDDQPNYSASSFPRIAVVEADTNIEGKYLGIYQNLSAGVGDYCEAVFVISIYAKEGMKLTIDSREYKNEEITNYLAEKLKIAFHTNRVPPYWKFYDWRVTKSSRVRNDEDLGIYRTDLTLEVRYFANGV